MADMRIHQVMMTKHRLQDPLDISGCVLWCPLDRSRFQLPTGQKFRRFGENDQEYLTHNGVPCLHQTAVQNNSQRQWEASPGTTLAAGYAEGNGCSFSFWYYGNQASGSNILQLSVSNNNVYSGWLLLVSISSSNITLKEYTSDGSTTVMSKTRTNLTANQWNNVCFTCSASGAITMYVNKTSKGTANASAGFAGWIGSRCIAPNSGFSGYLAGCRLYDHVLTSAERTKLYNEFT